MARRNGRGSKSLADTITQFERSEIRLLKSASQAQILSPRETVRLEERFNQSSSQKRSTDVLAAAIHLNKLLSTALKEAPGGQRPGARSEYEIMAEMGAALRLEKRPAEAVADLLKLLGELVPFDRASVYVHDPVAGRLEPFATLGEPVDLIDGVSFELGSGFSAWVGKRKKATLLTDLQRPPREGERPLRCFMSVPVIVHGDLVGVLNLGHAEARAFEDEHVRLAGTVSSLLGATLTRVVVERLLAEHSATDPLTGLLTEKQLARRVYEETDRSRRHGDPLHFALVRIAGYSAFAAQNGSATAEGALRDLGPLVKANLRCADTGGRVGYEEMGLLLVHATGAEALAAVERLAEQVNRHLFPRRKRLRLEWGLAAFPEGGDDLPALVATARRRLSAAAQLQGRVRPRSEAAPAADWRNPGFEADNPPAGGPPARPPL
jgi:diguanylate cyclase (GGDEF)-like protein